MCALLLLFCVFTKTAVYRPQQREVQNLTATKLWNARIAPTPSIIKAHTLPSAVGAEPTDVALLPRSTWRIVLQGRPSVQANVSRWRIAPFSPRAPGLSA